MRVYKIVRKQGNARQCAVCGIDNEFGFDARFYETDTDEVICIFKTKEKQQSFPDRVHGGVISAVVDEAIGRAIWVYEPDVWAVTVNLELKYRQPVPLGENLKCLARITRNTRKIMEGTGEIYLPDGTIAVSGHAKYFKVPLDEVFEQEVFENQWVELGDENDPTEIII